MNEYKFNQRSSRSISYWLGVGVGLLLVIWQFFTLMELLEGHTAQAKKISQSAGWAGHPVGTMPQTQVKADAKPMTMQVMHYENNAGLAVRHANLP